MNVDVLRYAAFTDDPTSGNPAGVVVDAGQLTEQEMLGIAAGVGYSETAFITEVLPDRRPSARQAPDFQGRSYWMICPAVDTQPAQMSAAQNRQARFMAAARLVTLHSVTRTAMAR